MGIREVAANELANGRTAAARTTIDKALAMPLCSAELFWTASLVYRGSGDTAAAEGYRARAKKLNSRVDAEKP